MTSPCQATLARMKGFAWIRSDLTDEEKIRYGIYATMPAFAQGFDDYENCAGIDMGDGVQAQAYDRGAECAMQRSRPRHLPPGYQDNGDGTFSMDW
jgi:hypothetical protein